MAKKIVLEDCNVKAIQKLITRVSAIDQFVVFTIDGTCFESFASNSAHSMMKYVTTDISKYCPEGKYKNDFDGKAIIPFVSITKISSCLQILSGGTSVNSCTLIFDINEANGYCHKLTIKTEKVQINLPCAEIKNVKQQESTNAVFFLNDVARAKTIDKIDGKIYDFDINGATFKQLSSFISTVDSTSNCVFFSNKQDTVIVSEIQCTDKNKECVGNMVARNEVDNFNNFEKIYSFDIAQTNEPVTKDFVRGFNNKFFKIIDNDNTYTFTIFEKMLKVKSRDDEYDTTTYVCMFPTVFTEVRNDDVNQNEEL